MNKKCAKHEPIKDLLGTHYMVIRVMLYIFVNKKCAKHEPIKDLLGTHYMVIQVMLQI